MNIATRIAKLELRQPPAGCSGCGYPHKVSPLRIIRGQSSEPLPACLLCGRLLNEKGDPLITPVVRVSRGVRSFVR